MLREISLATKAGTENFAEFYVTTSVLKMFGFPEWDIGFDPYKPGAGSGEWGVSLPDYVAEGLVKHFGADKVLIGPGNLFGLISDKDGLIKDGIKDVWINLKGKLVYLKKRD